MKTSLIGTLPINPLSKDEVVQYVMNHVRRVRDERAVGKAIHIFGVNAQIAVLVQEDARFNAAIATAGLLFADGISIILASKLLGCPLPERVPGGEVMESLCEEAAKEGRSAYFLGGLPGAAQQTAKILSNKFPGLKIAGTYCPETGFDKRPEELAEILKSIQDTDPDLLFVCFGVPKQEIWILDNSPVLRVGLAFPVGAAFDTTAGLRKRAPRWTHNIGAEWLYRLLMEPRRLWRRYLIGNPKFVVMVFKQWWQQRKFLAVSG